MSNLKVIIVASAVLFLFNSCEEKEDIVVRTKTLCEFRTEKHFSGIIDGNEKCFNTGQSNYQSYSGASSNTNEGGPIAGRYILGMDTFPVNVGDEHILLYTPIVVLKDTMKIASLFPKRILSIDEISNYQLYYDLATKVENDITVERKRLTAYFDNDSSIEVVNYEKLTNGKIITFNVTLLINCKLYNDDGILEGEIKSGELAGTILLNL
jgi:hypothetical protein